MKVYRTVDNDTQVVDSGKPLADVLLDDMELLKQIGAEFHLDNLGGGTYALHVKLGTVDATAIYTT